GSWRVPCTIHNVTAIARQSVYWQLKKHANLITADFISPWLPHGSRSRVIDDLFASWDTDKPIREPAIGRH
ncbi:MAG: hypothetical protein WAN75_41500, partial [Xanthobacteraceae bacterium]